MSRGYSTVGAFKLVVPGGEMEGLAHLATTRAVFPWSQQREKLSLLGVDLIAFFLASMVGTFVQSLFGQVPETILSDAAASTAGHRLWLYIGLVAVAVLWFWFLGHYSRRRPFWDETRELLRGLATLAVVEAALMYLLQADFSRLWFVATWSSTLLLLPLSRMGWKRFLLSQGYWQLPTVILGAGENAREAAEALRSEPLMGFDITAFVAIHGHEVPDSGVISLGDRNVPVVRLGVDPITELKRMGRPNIVVALERGELSNAHPLVKKLKREFTNISIVPALKGLPLYGMEISHFFRHEALFLRVRNNLGRRGPRLIKRTFDIVGASLLLVLLSPLFAFLVWKIRQDGGPAFFGHTRVGQNGKHFKCYKFRSMVPNAAEVLKALLEQDPEARAEWERDFKLKNDPRITAIGRFLRKTSLDELPQLWNVLRGEMSLVGPRPIVDAELERYGDEVDYYLEAAPGMTGLWQISGRNDTDYANRVYLDAWYAKNWSLWYDIVILIKTINVVLNRDGAY